MKPERQTRIGLALGAAIIAAWLCLHIVGIFLLEPAFSLLVLLLVVLQTWLSVGMYIVAHDAMHGSLAPTRRTLGNAVGALAVALYAGFSWRRLVPMHHAHHRHAGSADDPDFAPAHASALLPWYARFMRTYFGGREFLIMFLRVGLYMLLGARVESILLFFALPGLLSSFQLFYFGTYLPHRHEEGGEFVDRHRARSNGYGYLASLLSCFHFGYHLEHHRRPDQPWWRLPAQRNGG